MFLPCYLKSRAKQFYSGYLPGLLTTGDNKRMSRWEILHRAITRLGKVKLPGLGGCPSFHVLLAPRILHGHFFLAVFFRVTHNRLSKRGTTHGLYPQFLSIFFLSKFMLNIPITFTCHTIILSHDREKSFTYEIVSLNILDWHYRLCNPAGVNRITLKLISIITAITFCLHSFNSFSMNPVWGSSPMSPNWELLAFVSCRYF